MFLKASGFQINLKFSETPSGLIILCFWGSQKEFEIFVTSFFATAFLPELVFHDPKIAL
jgi:hypothetical protein